MEVKSMSLNKLVKKSSVTNTIMYPDLYLG
jgi:hypothetical protein